MLLGLFSTVGTYDCSSLSKISDKKSLFWPDPFPTYPTVLPLIKLALYSVKPKDFGFTQTELDPILADLCKLSICFGNIFNIVFDKIFTVRLSCYYNGLVF